MAETSVRLPNGAIARVRHPPGATDEQILRFAKSQFNSVGIEDATISRPSISPATGRGDDSSFRKFVSEKVEAGNPSFLESLFNPNTVNVTPEQGRAALPIVAGTAASIPFGGVLGSSLAFGGGAAGGELLGNLVGGNATLPQAAETGATSARDALVGGVAFRALSPVARAVFGRAPTAEGEAALEFARRRSAEMADEAFFGTPFGREVPSAGVDAAERGAPRLPLDSITDGSLLDGARMLVVGARNANARAKQAAQFINRELASITGEVPKTASVVQDAKQLIFADENLRSLRQFSRLDGDKWVDEVVTGANASALAELARSSPELHRQVLAKNLENTINAFSRNSPDLGLRVLDGQGFRKWFESNRSDILRVYGFGTAKKLDDFTNYAQFLDGAVTEAERGLGGSMGRGGTIFRTALEGGGAGILPKVVLPLQASAWVLGNTLMNPNAATFKFFSALPKAGRAVRTGAEAGAVEAEAGSPLGDPAQMFRQFRQEIDRGDIG